LLPKDLTFRITKHENWYELYDYYNINSKGAELLKPDPFKYKPISPLRDDPNIENIINNIQNTKEAKTKSFTKNNLFEQSINHKEKLTLNNNAKMNEPTPSNNDTSDDIIKAAFNANVCPDPAVDLA
jgi:hypothetical protein